MRAAIYAASHSHAEEIINYYSARPVEFINDFCVTYDPRNAGAGFPTLMPFVLFPRQVELIQWLHGQVNEQESGLVEKCRAMGVTWVCCAYAVRLWLWLFVSGTSVGFGSRKEMLVDRLGDPDSIFEKMRILLRNLPARLLPDGFSGVEHSHFMWIVNPVNNATITGEAGDNIGRGGRRG